MIAFKKNISSLQIKVQPLNRSVSAWQRPSGGNFPGNSYVRCQLIYTNGVADLTAQNCKGTDEQWKQIILFALFVR